MTAAEKIEDEPGHFSNQAWLIGEIVLTHGVLARKINDLRSANQARAVVNQKLMAEEVSRVAGQIKACADIIARLSADYANRSSKA